jgi:3-hydroxyacyl-CoA dehydrogenase
MMNIQKAAVLGAGTMGAQIAAHLANAGLHVALLDIQKDLAERGLRGLVQTSPLPLFTESRVRQIETGAFESDLQILSGCDWILEAVVEDTSIKRELLKRVDAVRRPGSWITTNTSGLSVAALADGLSADFRQHWFGTHFFNPPRYLKLLEIIPTMDTEPAVLDEFEQFANIRLGKGVVRAKDTPNFIANRIGLYAALQAIRLMSEFELNIEEVDRLTGTLIGRAKTATFRTIDMVGLDIFVHVAENVFTNAPTDPERQVFEIPAFIRGMIERKMLGSKTGHGFYKKEADTILALDPATLEYRRQQRVQFPALEMAFNLDALPDRLRAVFQSKDRGGQFVRKLLLSTMTYAASMIPEISDDIVSVDRAMRWGFAWELGPFELWDALGTADTAQRWTAEGHPLPPLLPNVIESGGRFYKDGTVFAPIKKTYQALSTPAGWTILKHTGIIHQNSGACLRDLGDGVACLEFHSKMNAIGGDIVSMLFASLDEVNRNFAGLVIGNQGPHFSAGANLMLLLMEAVEGNWDEIDAMVRTFQRATRAIKYNLRPVVCAPFGMTLGGGCEFAISSSRIQAAAETYIGLVEFGAGLIPAGGGTTEMAVRAGDDPAAIRRAFENIALAKVSSSAEDARRLHYLRDGDGITMNGERVIEDAKRLVLEMAGAGYQPPVPSEIKAFGDGLAAELKLGIHLMLRAGHITEHEALVARKLAHVICGGNISRPGYASEQYFLDLEREAFVSLCGQRNTLARMENLLKKGKVLRN